MLFRERVDLVVGEQRILVFLALKLDGPGRVAVHSLFPPVNYPAAAWNDTLRQASMTA